MHHHSSSFISLFTAYDLVTDPTRIFSAYTTYVTDLTAVPAVAAAAAAATSSQRPEEILQSTTDAEEWRMEVEKVAPQLKVTVRVDNRDWRTHLEQMHSYRTGIEEALTTTKVQLDKLHADIARTLEKIASREKYLNSQLEGGLLTLRYCMQQFSSESSKGL